VNEFSVVALNTFLEGFKVLWIAMQPILKDVDGFALAKADVGKWVEDRKANLSNLRNAVAHPNTTLVRAIDESGDWEPTLTVAARAEAGWLRAAGGMDLASLSRRPDGPV
jgi:hypothetical protein